MQDNIDEIIIEYLFNYCVGFVDIFVVEYCENLLVFDMFDKKLKLLINRLFLFESGIDCKYFNYGYVVLGVIFEKVMGKLFEVLL